MCNFLGHATHLTTSEECQVRIPRSAQRKVNERESINLHSESMSFDVCSFCDVFVLWCFFLGTSTRASTNNFNDDVWRIYMRRTHSYYNIWILRCMCKIDAIENETAPRRLIGLYASLRICHLSSCFTRPGCFWTMLTERVSLLMLVYSMKESEGMSGFQKPAGCWILQSFYVWLCLQKRRL